MVVLGKVHTVLGPLAETFTVEGTSQPLLCPRGSIATMLAAEVSGSLITEVTLLPPHPTVQNSWVSWGIQAFWVPLQDTGNFQLHSLLPNPPPSHGRLRGLSQDFGLTLPGGHFDSELAQDTQRRLFPPSISDRKWDTGLCARSCPQCVLRVCLRANQEGAEVRGSFPGPNLQSLKLILSSVGQTFISF